MKIQIFLPIFLFMVINMMNCLDKAPIYSISIQEKYFDSPEDCINLIEEAINENDPIKFISYFPIQQDMENINFADLSLRLRAISSYNNKYYPGFERMMLLKIIDDYTGYYNMIKMGIIEKVYPDFEPVMMVNNKKEIDKVYKIIKDITETKIKIESTEKLVYDRSSLYAYTEAYLFLCNLSFNDQVIFDSMMINVQKINKKWRIISVFTH